MEKLIEQTLSKPTLQFGLRPLDYLVLFTVATVGNFFVPRSWLSVVLIALIIIFRVVNKSKRRYFWSSIYIWIVTNTNLDTRQSKKLPPMFSE